MSACNAGRSIDLLKDATDAWYDRTLLHSKTSHTRTPVVTSLKSSSRKNHTANLRGTMKDHVHKGQVPYTHTATNRYQTDPAGWWTTEKVGMMERDSEREERRRGEVRNGEEADGGERRRREKGQCREACVECAPQREIACAPAWTDRPRIQTHASCRTLK